MPAQSRNTNKDEVVILEEKFKKPQKRMKRSVSSSSTASNIKMETSSSLAVLGDKLTKDLVSAAETAIKSHLEQLRNSAKNGQKSADKSAIVLQLSLPKELQVKLMEQLKSQGKAADQIDMNNLFSEVFNRTLRRMNGLEITNCSLRINSAKKRPNESLNATPEVPAKKVKTLNNNTTSQNGHHNIDPIFTSPPNGMAKRPRGRPPKSPKVTKIMNCPRRLNAHAVKEWPYQPTQPDPKDEIK